MKATRARVWWMRGSRIFLGPPTSSPRNRSSTAGDIRMPQSPKQGARYASLGEVERAVIRCERCERLRRHCLEVARERTARFRDQTYWGRPVPGFGDPRARLLVVGLAPAAHGGNRT